MLNKQAKKPLQFFCRIFDSKKVQSVHNNKEWLDTTCNHTLFRMTDAFNLFFVKLAPLLLTDLLNQFEWCVLQDNDQLARSASSCLETLVNISPNPLNLIEKPKSCIPKLRLLVVKRTTMAYVLRNLGLAVICFLRVKFF